MKQALLETPLIGPLLRRVRGALRGRRFTTARNYWEDRYADGGTSGPGSYGQLAEYKATVLNAFVEENGIVSVMEFGCGDGSQLQLARYPSYIGLDVSPSAIALCCRKFETDPTKSFFLYDSLAFRDRGEVFRADLTMSLDVVYHLVEDAVYEAYMGHLFGSARRFVAIYSSNSEEACSSYLRHRRFTDWIGANAPDWELHRHIENPHPFRGDAETGSFSDFFLFRRRG